MAKLGPDEVSKRQRKALDISRDYDRAMALARSDKENERNLGRWALQFAQVRRHMERMITQGKVLAVYKNGNLQDRNWGSAIIKGYGPMDGDVPEIGDSFPKDCPVGNYGDVLCVFLTDVLADVDRAMEVYVDFMK